MSLGRHAWFCGSILALVAIGYGTARADAIDGEWCFSTVHLNIQGPSIRTPGGNQIQGTYDRHSFHYIAPANEKDAGAEVIMRLLNEENLALVRKTGAAESAPESWKRCKPIS